MQTTTRISSQCLLEPTDVKHVIRPYAQCAKLRTVRRAHHKLQAAVDSSKTIDDRINHSTTNCPTSALSPPALSVVAIALPITLSLIHPYPALAALTIHQEPTNALSIPTWAVHTSSVIEWATAMGLMWKYAEAVENPLWKGMAWGMLPCLGSAMCAVTWHMFYNAHELEFLVALQAGLTVVGNCTCWWAAYRIYNGAQAEAEEKGGVKSS